MSLYTRLVASAIFPLHECLKGHSTAGALRSMEQSQWLSRTELQAFQLARLRTFLERIGRDVPYYRDLFRDIGFSPVDVNTLADLQRLPITGKPDIRENLERMKADNAGPLERFSTGGSSGEPLVFYRGKERVSHDVAAKWRATRWWNVDIGDREIVIWGSPIELGSQDRVRMIRDKLLRTELLSAFEMSEDNLDRFIRRIQVFKPRMLFGYPSSLALMARYAADKGLKMDELGIKVVFVTSESLYPHQRETIESVYGAPVANGYGGRDGGFIAHQCPSGSMHITAEDIVVEIVDGKGNVLPTGQNGEIVITHMAMGDFPFVRYRTGDVGSLSDESCSCGRGLPLLKEIEGRTTDFIMATDGTVIHGLALIYILRELPQVGEFKIIQDALDRITVQLVINGPPTAEMETEITAQFRRRLGNTVSVIYDYVEKIPTEASGKFRYVVSHVAH